MKALIVLLLALIGFGCSKNIMPDKRQNPSPDEKFSHFNRFELLPLKTRNVRLEKYSQVLAEIQQNIDELLVHRVDSWNAKPLEAPVRTLIIEPVVTALAHRRLPNHESAVVLSVKFTDKETHKELAWPAFYAQSSSSEEIEMLKRIANSFAVYTLDNYRQAIGGPVMPTEVEAASMRFE